MYNPDTGKTVQFAAAQNYLGSLAELDNEEVDLNSELANLYVEYANVGAGVGGGFENTNELKPMKYEQVINGPDAKAWRAEIDNEHDRMVKNSVFEPVKRKNLPPGMKVIDSTWACKKKSNGTLRGRLNARGFKQVEGKHYDGSSIHAPVTNPATIRIVMTLMLMAGWVSSVVNVEGEFLHGNIEDNEEIHMEAPKGFEKHYDKDVVLKLKRCLYGLKQAAMAFWKQLLSCMKDMHMA